MVPINMLPNDDILTSKILILDFGSQVTQLIARRVREAGVYSEILPCTVDAATIEEFNPTGIILSGGPASVTGFEPPSAPQVVFELGVPVLGICYGMQTMCAQLGGVVYTCDEREFGRTEMMVTDTDCNLFQGIPLGQENSLNVWMSHGDRVEALPGGFNVAARSKNCPHAVIADESRQFYGVQFHPEVMHTPYGTDMLQNFARLCGPVGEWKMAAFKDMMVEQIRQQVGDGKVICGLSGGVDSSVTAILLHEAIGSQLTCIFVDNGLLRGGEAEQVVSLFKQHYNIPLVHVEAQDLFLGRLAGVADPEQKRKIIGNTFIEVFEQESAKLGHVDFLAQGTLYPDVIESISFKGPSATIKTHHNVGGLPERMNLKLVEPLRELFKDEVRALGRELGLNEAFISRHPFPGPGLAIRVPGEVTADKLELLRKADGIYLEEIRAAGLYDDIWQAFTVLLPVKTVGVMGDGRTYEFACSLRAVTATDGMTADFFEFPHAVIGRIATRIVNEVKGINRVLYDVTSKPPGTIEWE